MEIFSLWIPTCDDCCVYTLCFFRKTAPAKIQSYTQNFCKNKFAKFNRHLHFSQAQNPPIHNFLQQYSLAQNEKSPKKFSKFSRNFSDFYYFAGCLGLFTEFGISVHLCFYFRKLCFCLFAVASFFSEQTFVFGICFDKIFFFCNKSFIFALACTAILFSFATTTPYLIFKAFRSSSSVRVQKPLIRS